jgi:uncharacterized repeat protein (TIGR03803 family)
MTSLLTYGRFTCVPRPSRKGSRIEKFGLLKQVCMIFVVCGATAVGSLAQTVSTLFSFDGTDGFGPNGLIQATDGNFYGTTSGGGTSSNANCYRGCGTVFKITPEGVLTTLHSFNFDDGALPLAGLIQAVDGNFYGTTSIGGANTDCFGGCGTVFKITPEGVLTTLHIFEFNEGNGPQAALLQATDWNLYGTTNMGGPFSQMCQGNARCGTVFKITTGGTLTTLHSFDGTDGSQPQGGLVQAPDGNFYGTTSGGGLGGDGTVFEITPSGKLTTLHSFEVTDGSEPQGGLIQATDGRFYGTTLGGGTNLDGTVFKINSAATLTTLHSFELNEGALPFAGLIQATDGNFYGTAWAGGSMRNCPYVGFGCGTIFEITPEGTLDRLYSFCQTSCVDGLAPTTALVQATDGNFYGTTSAGGAHGYGTVFTFPVVQRMMLSPTSASFGDTVIHTTSEADTVTVDSTGSVMLEISSITASANFEVSSTTCGPTLAVGKKCYVGVKMKPTAPGKVTGTLTFADNAPNSPQTVALSGYGIEPATLFPASMTYAAQAVGTTSLPKMFTLSNHQTAALNNIVISTNGKFAVSSTTCTTSLAAQSKCTISVTFTPTAKGTRTGDLSVRDSSANSPQKSSLTGTGK